MRTTMDIDGRLLRKAVRYAHTKTKKEAIERGLRELINAERRRRLIAMHGTGYGMTLSEFLRTRRDE